MRVLIALCAFTFTACRSSGPSLDAEYRAAQNLLVTERYDQALARTNQALIQAERSPQASDRWRFRLLKADIMIGQRQSAQTLAILDGYGDTPSGPDWTEVRAHILLLRGRALYGLNRFGESRDALARAAEAAKQIRSEPLAAEALLRQGFLLILEAKFAEARDTLRRVAETAKQLHDPYLEANAIGNMGFDLLTESRNDEAIPWFDRAIDLFTKIDAQESVARTHGNLGNCYRRLGDYETALQHFQKAQEWFAKTGNRDAQQIWIGNAGNVSYNMEDYPAAETAYQHALEIARQVPSPVWIERWLINLASTSVAQGRWDEAEAYNNQALQEIKKLQDAASEPTAVVNAGQIEEGRGHLDRARELFHSALSKRAEDPGAMLDAHSGLARTYIREGRAREAETEFQSAVGMIERRGAELIKDDYKLTYLASLVRFYREYVDFLVASHQLERALEIAESSRTHVLEQKSGHAETQKPHTTQDYLALARQTRSTLLEYWLSPGQSYLWVITPGAIRMQTLPAQKALQPLLENYRAVVTGGRNPLEVAGDTGRKLSATLLSPATGVAEGRFLVVADGALDSFPLESLPATSDPHKFWIQEASVAFAPSLNYLASQTSRRSGSPAMRLLAIGDPQSATQEYPRLEFASQEMDSIAAALGGSRAAIVRGDAATPDSYAAAEPGRFEFIHFAAHATANQQSPLDSAVILSGAADHNRLLARAVTTVPLSAELVTISACRSAGGRTYAGEGLVGFAWAFLRAGARNVVAGLWDVSDRATEELMTDLYRRLASGESAQDALRSAKLELIRSGGSYAKPLYWAPFQLYAGASR